MSPYTIRDISCYVVCKMTDRLILLCNMLRCTVLHSTRPHPQKSLTKKINLSLLHKSKFWGGQNTIHFQVSQIQIFFQQIAWGRGTSRLLVRQGRLLYLSTILRNKSVSTNNCVFLKTSEREKVSYQASSCWLRLVRCRVVSDWHLIYTISRQGPSSQHQNS